MEAVTGRPISLSPVELPRANESVEVQQPSSAWTFDPVVLLQLGRAMLEATELGLCLLGLSVLRSHPCPRICLRLWLRLRLRLRLRLWLRMGLRLRQWPRHRSLRLARLHDY